MELIVIGILGYALLALIFYSILRRKQAQIRHCVRTLENTTASLKEAQEFIKFFVSEEDAEKKLRQEAGLLHLEFQESIARQKLGDDIDSAHRLLQVAANTIHTKRNRFWTMVILAEKLKAVKRKTSYKDYLGESNGTTA